MSRLRLASWNVNSLKVRLPQVLAWLGDARIDALAIEETKLTDEAFPKEAFEEAGFDVIFAGQKTYNGVALCARRETLALENPLLSIPGYADLQKRFVSARLLPKAGGEPICFCAAYFPNGMAPGSAKYLYKLDWISALERHLRTALQTEPRLILAGDFNIAPADEDIWNPELWRGRILCSQPERAALSRLFALGLSDAFRLFEQPAGTFSWWDYRQNGFERNQGLRIDLLLVSEALRAQTAGASVDEGPRGNPQPSDHAPVITEIEA